MKKQKVHTKKTAFSRYTKKYKKSVPDMNSHVFCRANWRDKGLWWHDSRSHGLSPVWRPRRWHSNVPLWAKVWSLKSLKSREYGFTPVWISGCFVDVWRRAEDSSCRHYTRTAFRRWATVDVTSAYSDWQTPLWRLCESFFRSAVVQGGREKNR